MKGFLSFYILLMLGVSSYSEISENNDEEKKTYSSIPDGPVVHLKNGALRGKILHTLSGKKIYSFLGIRYAHPPTGKLRFKAPAEWSKPWEGVKNAYSDGNTCPQLSYPERKFQGDEDCLYLNVYTSKMIDVEDAKQEKQGVFVFLHGGGFSYMSGHSEDYGPQYLLEHDLILVTPNYRLGPFGFLSMGDDELPGNVGLLDQQLALQWVQKNIAAFGGDPNKVTLGGINAGAISTHIHALTPSSHGLFHRAIAMSGNALTSWGMIELNEAKLRAIKLIKLLGCKNKDKESTEISSSDILSCLSNADVFNIIWKSQFTMEMNTDFTFPFVPVLDINNKEAKFLQRYPQEMLNEGSFVDIPWMLGVTSLDGLPHSLQIMVSPWVTDAFTQNFEENVPAFLGLRSNDKENIKEAGSRIRKFYDLDDVIGFHSLKNLGEMFSDFYYFTTLLDTIKAYTSKNSSPLYAYHFSYNYRHPRVAIGVPQGDIVGYLFPGNNTVFRLEPKSADVKIVKKMTELVSSFVNKGIPTNGLSKNFSWIPATNEEVKFLDIDKKYKTMNESDFHPKRLKFWREIDSILQGEEVSKQKDEL